VDGIISHYGSLEPNTLVAFGLLLLFGVFGGVLANRVSWLPTISAFMLIGLVFGPHGINIFTESILLESELLVDIALGLILYKLGNMIHPRHILRNKTLLLTSLLETSLTFFSVMFIVMACGYNVAIAALIGAISISSSPAVLVHVSEEMKAKGPVTERTKSLVAMNNIISFLCFTAMLPFALSVKKVSWVEILLLPLYRFVIAAAIGVAVAWISTRIASVLRYRDEHYHFTIIAGSIALALGLSMMFHTSLLFSMLTLGVATRGFEKSHAMISTTGLSEGADLFFIILFVMAGAHLNIGAVAVAGFLPFLLVLARIASKFVGIFGVKNRCGHSIKECAATSLLLIPMAGMAIGLVTTLRNLVPEFGDQVSAIILTMVVVFETIGPFVAVAAFRLAGEAEKLDAEENVLTT